MPSLEHRLPAGKTTGRITRWSPEPEQSRPLSSLRRRVYNSPRAPWECLSSMSSLSRVSRPLELQGSSAPLWVTEVGSPRPGRRGVGTCGRQWAPWQMFLVCLPAYYLIQEMSAASARRHSRRQAICSS